MRLDSLWGNEVLRAQLAGERGLSHAYIISGPPGSGRRTLAGQIARALVCEAGTGCGRCAHCRKAEKGVHPDIIRLGVEKEPRVEDVRALRQDAFIRPNEAGRKVYLVENAQGMNPAAQNALLKLLEEGPAYAAFLLISDHPGALLDTVRSRCVELSLSPVTYAQALDCLRSRFPDRDPQAVEAAAARCGGLIGAGVAELSGQAPGEEEIRALALNLADLLAGGEELALLEFAVGLEKRSREELDALWSEELSLLRDALTAMPDPHAPAERRRAVSALSRLARTRLMALTELMDRLHSLCRANVGGGHCAGYLAAASHKNIGGSK